MNGALHNPLRILLPLTILCLTGCGPGATTSAIPAPSIVSQPANQSVPMGLTGTFTVQAYGAGNQYQWSRNGSLIPGATASTYTTPPTVFADTGTTFTVTLTNVSGSITTQPATLTVTARAPKPGDLRFQQVDAASTINGYSVLQGYYASEVFCPVPGGGGSGEGFGATGTAFFLGNLVCVDQFSAFALPVGVAGLHTGYLGTTTQDYQDELNAPPSYLGFPGPSDSGSVVTSLNLLPAYNSAELAFIHSDTSSGFVPTQYTVPAPGLQAFATQEGLRGHVITALSYDGTQATGFSYAWTGDPSTVYEAQVVFTTLDTATAQIQALAASGYIITATGSTQASDGSGVILIGTRVQGDIMPRPILVGDVLAGTVDPLLAKGYAIVAVVDKYQSNYALAFKYYIGER